MKIFLYVLLGIIIVLLIVYLIFHKQINFFVVLFFGKKRIQRKIYFACKANDFLIINDLYIPIDTNTYKKIDTIIFGNKFIYIVKELDCVGNIEIVLDDNSWRVINNDKLKLIDNPIKENKDTINILINNVKSLESCDLKNMIIIPTGCNYKQIENKDDDFIVSENEAIKFIVNFEKQSNVDIIDPKEIERICKMFYDAGLKIEKRLHNRNK